MLHAISRAFKRSIFVETVDVCHILKKQIFYFEEHGSLASERVLSSLSLSQCISRPHRRLTHFSSTPNFHPAAVLPFSLVNATIFSLKWAVQLAYVPIEEAEVGDSREGAN